MIFLLSVYFLIFPFFTFFGGREDLNILMKYSSFLYISWYSSSRYISWYSSFSYIFNVWEGRISIFWWNRGKGSSVAQTTLTKKEGKLKRIFKKIFQKSLIMVCKLFVRGPKIWIIFYYPIIFEYTYSSLFEI